MGLPILLTLAAYLRCLRNGFVYDDHEMVTLNRYIGGWPFIWKSFVNDSWWFRDPLRLPQSSYYRPLQDVWLGLNYHLFGPNPAGWHAMMIAVHLVAVGLMFVLAREFIAGRVGAVIAATLFGLLPIHAQAIAWPSAIPLPMSAVFEMAAMLFFIRRAQRPARYLTLALVFFAASLLSHESSIVFPFILIAYAFLLEPMHEDAGDAADPLHDRILDRIWRSAIVAAPFFAEVLVYLAIRSWELGFISRANRTNHMPLAEKLLTVPGVLANYLILLLAPWRAGPAHPVLPANSALAPQFYLPLLGLAATLTAVAILIGRSPHRRLYFFCAAWILIPIVPVLNLGALSPLALVEDRYLYLPSVGWCIFLGSVTARLLETRAQYSRYVAVAVGALAIAYGASLWRVEHYWHDEIALFSGCIEMSPDSTLCHGRLAMAYEEAGNWNGAAIELDIAERLYPDDGGTLYNLALLHDRFGAHRQAEDEMARALRLSPDAPVQPYLELARVADEAGDNAASERAGARAGGCDARGSRAGDDHAGAAPIVAWRFCRRGSDPQRSRGAQLEQARIVDSARRLGTRDGPRKGGARRLRPRTRAIAAELSRGAGAAGTAVRDGRAAMSGSRASPCGGPRPVASPRALRQLSASVASPRVGKEKPGAGIFRRRVLVCQIWRSLLAGIGRDPQVGAHLFESLGELLFEHRRVGDRGHDDAILAMLPVHRRRHRILVG